MKKVLSVKVKSPYILEILLSDNKTYLFDMGRHLNGETPMTAPLTDFAFFSKAFIENGQLTWPNGFDVHADTIAREGKVKDQQAS